MKQTLCDHCGKVIGYFHWQIVNQSSRLIQSRDGYLPDRHDFCSLDCIRDWSNVRYRVAPEEHKTTRLGPMPT